MRQGTCASHAYSCKSSKTVLCFASYSQTGNILLIHPSLKSPPVIIRKQVRYLKKTEVLKGLR